MFTQSDEKKRQQQKIAWQVAVESCIQSKEDPVTVFHRLMKKFQDQDEY